MSTESLKKIVSDVHQKKIVLPQFQRDFVWQPAAVIKLMVSIFNGYPIGALLLMENSGAYDSRPIEGVPNDVNAPETETALILDGQQRLTACYRAFYGNLDSSIKHPGRYYFKYKEYAQSVMKGERLEGSAIQDLFIFERPARVLKRLDSTSKEQSFGLFPLDIIFQTPRGSNYSDWLNTYNFSESRGDKKEFDTFSQISSEFQTNFIEKVTGYQINYEKITRDTSPDVICTIFETINTTGVKLTVFDLLVAKCFKANLRLRDKLEEALEQFQWIRSVDPDGQQIAVIQLPRILSLLHNGQCKKADILNMEASTIGERWDSAVAALDRALRIMINFFGVKSIENIPSMDVIAPLAVISASHGFQIDIHREKLEEWYWCIAFGQYLSGAPESKIARTIREWIKRDGGWLHSDDKAPEAVQDFSFRRSSLDDSTKQSAVYKGVLALILTNNPYDIGLERKPLRDLPSSEIQDHHIFPQKFLNQHGIKGVRANSILNRMPIWAKTNVEIGASPPHFYLERLELALPESQDTLDDYGLSYEMMKLRFSSENYELFLIDRKERLIKLIAKSVRKTEDQVAIVDE